jgi:hypothetical protein
MQIDRDVWIDAFRVPARMAAWLGALVALMLVAFAAHASTATLSWTLPTQNTDGSAIPATGPGSIASTRVEWGSCAGANVFGTKAGEVTVSAPGTSTTIAALAPATTYCFRAFARNTYAAESAASNVASKAMPTPVPNPPVLSATITVAFEAVRQGRQLALGRVVGTVQIGAPCLDNLVETKHGAFHEIAQSEVTLTRAPKGLIVTQCDWS